MQNSHDDGQPGAPATAAPAADQTSPAAAAALALLSGTALTACGGSAPAAAPAAPQPPAASPPVLPPLPAPTALQAARFLSQAAMGASREHIKRIQEVGYARWIDEQATLPPSEPHWDWLIRKGFHQPQFRDSEDGIDASLWRKMISAPDTLRQRMTLALSEILVVSMNGLLGPWLSFSAAAYLDLLQANAFGNFRTLLEKVTLSAPMGEYLSYRGSARADAASGSMPDENFPRELLQLFTIGLVELNLDGSPKLRAGKPQETFTLDDVAGLARVFTGWDYEYGESGTTTPEYKRRPLKQNPARHESGSKTFLGTTIGAETGGAASVRMALDALCAHPNVAPFISRQLIQRLVCSNPSPAYIARVATIFNNDGQGQKGNLHAVLKAILLDDEARSEAQASAPTYGKVREPILRLTAWGRAFGATSASDTWAIGNTADPATRLGQGALRAPSVFNFFRPDFMAPNSASGRAGLLAPELQIANESTVIGYVNLMQAIISGGHSDVKGDYSALQTLAGDAALLLDDINLVLAAGQLSAPTLGRIKAALESMPATSDATRLDRIHAALTLVMACPEFIVQK